MIPKFSEFLDDKMLQESINDKYLFKAVFMIGGSGSGKSFVANISFKGMGIFVNSDTAFEFLLSKNKLPFDIDDKKKIIYAKQMVQRKKAKGLITNRFHNWVNGMLPLIIDGTGKDYNKIKTQKEALESVGYDTSMIFVNTSLDVALERNKKRKRKVSEDIVKKSWNAVQLNIGKFTGLFGTDRMNIIDNNSILEGKALQEFKTRLYKYSIKLLNFPLSNRIGNNTVQELKRIKGKYITDLDQSILRDKSFKV